MITIDLIDAIFEEILISCGCKKNKAPQAQPQAQPAAATTKPKAVKANG